MNLSKKSRSIYLTIVTIIIVITVVFMKKCHNEKIIPVKNAEQKSQVTEQNNSEQKKFPGDIAPKTAEKIKFKSNDEIRKEYGKLETVYLWNGKKYTGAVITSKNIYSIVTVGGIFNIPMKDVKIRKIIR